jgi:hypothetical protein
LVQPEIINRINAKVKAPTPPYELRLHPRIVEVTPFINELPVGNEYRRWFRRSLWKYADQVLARPESTTTEEMADFGLIQQVSLGDWNETMLGSGMSESVNIGQS